jgi:hypothetical protein
MSDAERRFVRHLLMGLVAAVAIYVLLRVLSEQNLRGGVFDLRAQGWAAAFDCLFLIVLVEIPVALFSVGFDQINARKSVQLLAKLFLLIPLMAISWHILLAKFHAVYIDDAAVTLEGNSNWAHDTFAIAKIGKVELHRGRLWDELQFIWYDKIDASGGIWRFDTRAQAELDRLLAKFRERGIVCRETQP